MSEPVPDSSGPQAASSCPEVPSAMDEEAALLDAFTSVPQLAKAICRPGPSGGAQLQVHLSQHNLPANNKRTLQHTIHIPDVSKPQQRYVTNVPTEVQSSSLTSVSPSGTRMLVARANGDGSTVLQLWSRAKLLKELTVPKAQHGPVVNDGWFSRGAAWSSDESRVAYVAEAPAAERTPLWGGGEPKDSAAVKGWRGLGAWQEDWGELNTGKGSPGLYVLDTASYAVTRLQGQPQEHSCGQPVWTPDGAGIVFVAWPHQPPNCPQTSRKLGIVFCFNRPAYLMHLPYPAAAAAGDAPAPAAVRLSGDLLSSATPVFTPDGQQLVFLSHEAAARSGVHHATVALHSLPWPQALSGCAPSRAVVPVPQGPLPSSHFPGLYCTSLVEQPFLGPTTLLLTTQWRSQTVIAAVDLTSGAVTPVTPLGPERGSWALLGLTSGLLVASHSCAQAPPQLQLCHVGAAAAASGSSSWQWEAVHEVAGGCEDVPQVVAALANVETALLQVTPTVGDSQHVFEAVLQLPRNRSGPCPAIVFPHGGPHTAIAANYYMPFGFLTALGYAVVAVNYRGSTGFGEASLQSLPGHVGSHDVQDCVDALDSAIAAGYVDASRVAVIGGSHGGFLAGHLLGQHPGRFRCGGMRNPVCNISLMVGLSDIPDWCYVEVMGCQEGRKRFSGTPSPEDLAAMYAASPAAHVDKVAAPTAFMLGAKDRRVPLDDGKRYAAALASRGVETRVLVFPEDTHALDKPQTEFEQWLNLAWWLRRHMA